MKIHLAVTPRLTMCKRDIPEFPVRMPDGSYQPSLQAHRLIGRVTCQVCLDLFCGKKPEPARFKIIRHA